MVGRLLAPGTRGRERSRIALISTVVIGWTAASIAFFGTRGKARVEAEGALMPLVKGGFWAAYRIGDGIGLSLVRDWPHRRIVFASTIGWLRQCGGTRIRRTAPRWAAVSIGTMVFAAMACGGPTAPSPNSLRGEVSDPAGDSPADTRVATTSDLVHATAEVAGENITFVVQFAPGTLERQLTRVVILLDTDLSAFTGIKQNDGTGADYALELASTQATISKGNPVTCAARQGCFDAIRSEPVTTLTDSMQVTVSLATLGNASGRMTFKLHTYVTVVIGQTLTPITFDWMPDEFLAPGRIQ